MSDYIGPPRVKTAALGAIAGAVSAYRERENLRKAGVPEHEIDAALTTGGGALRGLGRDFIYGSLGNILGTGVSGLAVGHHAMSRPPSDLDNEEVRNRYANSIDRAGTVGAGLGSLLAAYHQAGSEEERALAALARHNK